MEILDFRAHMVERVRAFDKWVWRDYLENPAEVMNLSLEEWLDMFNTFMENDK